MNYRIAVLVSALAASTVLLYGTARSAHAACTWTVKGRIGVEHQLKELRETYGSKSMLRNIRVKISAKSKVGFVWGTYASWGTVRTKSNGEFFLRKRKGCGDRKFKIRVKFDDKDLELRHSKATRSAKKVKWYTVVKGVKRSAGTYNLGEKRFRKGGRHDLGNSEARAHADMWVVYKDAIDYMRKMGSAFAFTTKIKVKHPHNSLVVSDSKEASYANPTTKVIYIFESHFNTPTLLHELGHIWAYNHTSGEICLTERLLLTGNTHGLVKDPCVAFHEGFAEWYSDKMLENLYGGSSKKPYSRKHLKSAYGLTTRDRVQRHDSAWTSIFHMFVLPAIHTYDFNTTATRVAKTKPTGPCRNIPSNGFKKVLKVFNPASSKGYAKKLSRGETSIDGFFNRAASILTTMSTSHRNMYKELADTTKTSQPSDWLCRRINRRIKKKSKTLTRPKRLRRPRRKR